MIPPSGPGPARTDEAPGASATPASSRPRDLQQAAPSRASTPPGPRPGRAGACPPGHTEWPRTEAGPKGTRRAGPRGATRDRALLPVEALPSPIDAGRPFLEIRPQGLWPPDDRREDPSPGPRNGPRPWPQAPGRHVMLASRFNESARAGRRVPDSVVSPPGPSSRRGPGVLLLPLEPPLARPPARRRCPLRSAPAKPTPDRRGTSARRIGPVHRPGASARRPPSRVPPPRHLLGEDHDGGPRRCQGLNAGAWRPGPTLPGVEPREGACPRARPGQRWMMTSAPRGRISNSSFTSSLRIRMQPRLTSPPTPLGSEVP